MPKVIPTFKLLLIGDVGVGKSSFIKAYLTGKFDTRYTPTVGADVCHLTLQTTSGEVRFYIWDVSGSIEGRSVQNALFAHSDCAIIMFDRTSINTSEHVSNWYDDLQRVCGNIPVVAVGNKNESKNRKDGSYRTRDLTYFQISSVTGKGIDKPLRYLLRELLNDERLELIDETKGGFYKIICGKPDTHQLLFCFRMAVIIVLIYYAVAMIMFIFVLKMKLGLGHHFILLLIVIFCVFYCTLVFYHIKKRQIKSP